MHVADLKAKTRRDIRPCRRGSPRPHSVADNLLKLLYSKAATNRNWAGDNTRISTMPSWEYLGV